MLPKTTFTACVLASASALLATSAAQAFPLTERQSNTCQNASHDTLCSPVAGSTMDANTQPFAFAYHGTSDGTHFTEYVTVALQPTDGSNQYYDVFNNSQITPPSGHIYFDRQEFLPCGIPTGEYNVIVTDYKLNRLKAGVSSVYHQVNSYGPITLSPGTGSC